MARITFAKDQPIQSLSGSLGRITYRTVNGHTFAYRKNNPVLPKNPTRKQRAQFKKRTIIDNCVSILQSQIKDIQEAITMRPKIRERLRSLYNKFEPTIKAPTKLQKAIMSEYYVRFSATSPRDNRDITETKPRQSRGHHKKPNDHD